MTPAEALTLAQRLHAGQVDKSGAPYWTHCQRVAARLRQHWPDAPAHELEAALLHDAVEDTDATAVDLQAAGVSPEAVTIIKLVTKDGPHAPPGLAYLDWIKAIAAIGNASAIRVKLADLADNSDPTRLPHPPGFEERVRDRYAPAIAILEDAMRTEPEG